MFARSSGAKCDRRAAVQLAFPHLAFWKSWCLEAWFCKIPGREVSTEKHCERMVVGLQYECYMWSCFSGGFGLCKVAFLIALLLCCFLLLYDESRWELLQRRVGHREKPFRISLEYIAKGNKSIAAVDSFAMKNCTTGNVPYFYCFCLTMFWCLF